MKQMIGDAWARFQVAWPPNRIVVLLTPLVFAPLAALITGWVASHVPGAPEISDTAVVGAMAAGFLVAWDSARRWLNRWVEVEDAPPVDELDDVDPHDGWEDANEAPVDDPPEFSEPGVPQQLRDAG